MFIIIKMYSVSDVQMDKNPESEFDDPLKFKSFVDYYGKKGIDILNKTSQPLLKCKATAKQLNFLVAKYSSWKVCYVL